MNDLDEFGGGICKDFHTKVLCLGHMLASFSLVFICIGEKSLSIDGGGRYNLQTTTPHQCIGSVVIGGITRCCE
jgi:hypothetical protein